MEEQSSPQLTPETPLEPTDSAETNISHPAESRQEENSVVSPEESVGAAPAGFNSVRSDMVGSQDKTVTTDPYLTRLGRQKTAAYATGEVHDSSGATAATPTRTRRDGGNATVFSTVSQEGQSRQEENAGRDETPQRTHNGGIGIIHSYYTRFSVPCRVKQHIDLDELASTSVRVSKIVPDVGNLHGDDASGGWNYRTAYFEDFDGKNYRVRLSVEIGKDGNAVYNIGDMQERSVPTKISGSSVKDGAQSRDASFKNKIPYSDTAVKPKPSIDTNSIGNEDAESLRRRNAELEKRVAELKAVQSASEPDDNGGYTRANNYRKRTPRALGE